MDQYFIDIANFSKKEDELETRLDKWMYVLKNIGRLKEIPESLKGDPVFEKLFKVASSENLNEAELKEYTENLKHIQEQFRDSEVTGIKITILKV